MKDFIKEYGAVMFSTTELVVTIVIFILAGQWLDNKYHWNQKGLIISSILGSILAFVRFVIRLQKINNQPPQG